VNLDLRLVGAPLRASFAAGHGDTEYRDLLVLGLDDRASGKRGRGEAAPLESYDGISTKAVIEAINDCSAPLRGAGTVSAIDPRARAELLAECERLAVLPQAVAAIEMALWDLAGRVAGQPVWRLLDPHANPPAAVPVNYTISSSDRRGAAGEAAYAREAGFGTVKLKVGIGDDAGRVAAVRAAAGPDMLIRLDANGVWSVEEAIRWLEVLEPAGIELCEEPVHGLDAIAEVARRSPVPVAIDESATDPAVLSGRHAHALCLKIGRCGGISGAIDQARLARALGYEVYLASTLDGPLGIAAALHAAAAIQPDRPSGLATLPLFGGRSNPLPAHDGAIQPPTEPGLGGDELTRWYAEP
jgi:L-alanine-DL-glutamate epimerase-like enolase superfamily enzyme